MNSKEALEFLTEGICNCPICSKYVECMDLDEYESVCENAKFIIKKDLIKLEQLEKGNQELKETINDLQKDYDALDFEQVELYAENTKLKKALDILKNKVVNISQLLKTTFIVYNSLALLLGYDKLTREEYELLKEVLKNV